MCNEELEDISHIILPKFPKLKLKAQQLLYYAQDILETYAPAAELFINIFILKCSLCYTRQ